MEISVVGYKAKESIESIWIKVWYDASWVFKTAVWTYEGLIEFVSLWTIREIDRLMDWLTDIDKMGIRNQWINSLINK